MVWILGPEIGSQHETGSEGKAEIAVDRRWEEVIWAGRWKRRKGEGQRSCGLGGAFSQCSLLSVTLALKKQPTNLGMMECACHPRVEEAEIETPLGFIGCPP